MSSRQQLCFCTKCDFENKICIQAENFIREPEHLMWTWSHAESEGNKQFPVFFSVHHSENVNNKSVKHNYKCTGQRWFRPHENFCSICSCWINYWFPAQCWKSVFSIPRSVSDLIIYQSPYKHSNQPKRNLHPLPSNVRALRHCPHLRHPLLVLTMLLTHKCKDILSLSVLYPSGISSLSPRPLSSHP